MTDEIEENPEATENPRAFLDSLEDYKEDNTLKNFKSDIDFVKNFKENESFLGRSIRVPGEDATDESRAQFYEKLAKAANGKLMPVPDREDKEAMESVYSSMGKPKESSEYSLPEVDGVKLSDDQVNDFREVAHQLNLPKDGFKDMMTGIMAKEGERLEAERIQRDNGKKQLETEWGQAYDGKMERIYTVINQTGAPTDVVDAIKAGKMGPESLKWLDAMAENLQGSKMEISGQAPTQQIGTTPAEAKEQAAELRDNIRSIRKSDPTYSAKLQKLQELTRLSMGG